MLQDIISMMKLEKKLILNLAYKIRLESYLCFHTYVSVLGLILVI